MEDASRRQAQLLDRKWNSWRFSEENVLKPEHIVGTATQRKEGLDKVTGRSRYVDDIEFPNMLHGATVRSRIPRGRIRNITFGPGVAWDEFVVVTAKDIPGKNYIALIENDQPCLADGVVNHAEEPILLLAHPVRHALPAAGAAPGRLPLRASGTPQHCRSRRWASSVPAACRRW